MEETYTNMSSSSSSSGGVRVPVAALCAALGSPLVYSVVNVVDKLAVERRVQHTVAYVAIVGIFDAAAGLLIAPLGRWDAGVVSQLPPIAWGWPVLAGVSLGCGVLLYYLALESSDASRVVGFEYTYPALVCLLSWLVLHEPIGVLGYVGIATTVCGAVVLSLDLVRTAVRLLCKLLPRRSRVRARFEELDKRRLMLQAEEALHGSKKCRCEDTWCFTAVIARILPFGDPQADDDDDDDDNAAAKETVAPTPCSSPSQSPPPDVSGSIQSYPQLHKARQPPAIIEDDEDVPEDVPIMQRQQRQRQKKRRQWASMFLLVPLVVFIAGSEFLSKLATMQLPGNNVAAISSVAFGLTLSLVIVLPSARHNFVIEFKRNWRWALASETLTVAAAWLLVLGMAGGLSAPVASSLSAAQPFCVLVLEFTAGISSDTTPLECLSFKLFPISLIIGGVVLISLSVLTV